MQILVTGSKGQLGSELQSLAHHYPHWGFQFTDVDVLDVSSPSEINAYFKHHAVDCLVHCAGYTAVDGAENDIQAAQLVNSRAPGFMAEAASKKGALMVHISTDYVFDGKNHRPYTEQHSANPLSVYGKSKLDGEVEVIFNAKRSVIIRTSWLYSQFGSNFLKSILTKAKNGEDLKVVSDQVGSPTHAADLARAILEMIPALPKKIRGEIYHYSNQGVASWFDFARAIVDIEGMENQVVPILTKDLTTQALRPHYSVLNTQRFRDTFGLGIPYWRDSVAECLALLRG